MSSPFGQLVVGPPGSGKSTYCYGLHQFLTALNRPVLIVNLDPAAPHPPYPSSISITSLISLEDAMSAHGLGPNGAMLYCLEYLEKNLDWLEEELERAMGEMGWTGERRGEAFVVFDTPGQVELSTDHGSLKRIVRALEKKGGWRVSSTSYDLVLWIVIVLPLMETDTEYSFTNSIACGSPPDRCSSYNGCRKICCPPTFVPPNHATNGITARQCSK